VPQLVRFSGLAKAACTARQARGVFSRLMFGDAVAERRQVDPGEHRFALPEHDRGHGEMQVVDQAGAKILTHRLDAAAHLHVATIGGELRLFQRRLDALGHEDESCATFHLRFVQGSSEGILHQQHHEAYDLSAVWEGTDEFGSTHRSELEIDKDMERPSAGEIGFSVEDGKAIMALLQQAVVNQQSEAYVLTRRFCTDREGFRRIKDYRVLLQTSLLTEFRYD
jgi:hypothetical protein